MSEYTQDDEERLDTLAAHTLRAAIDQDWPRCQATLIDLSRQFGGHGLIEAIYLWCDALIDHYGGHGEDKMPIGGIQMQPVGSNKVSGLDTVSAELAWAVRLITARQLRDKLQVEALIMVLACTDDNRKAGRYIQALLNVTAMSLAEHLKTCPVGIGGMHHDPDDDRPAAVAIPSPPPGQTWN